VADAGLFVQPEGIAGFAGDARSGEVMALTPVQLQTKPAGQLDADLTVKIDVGRHFRASHSSRRGQPAAIQSRSSSVRHSTERPTRTGWGIQPAASHERQVRNDLEHIAAAALAVTSRGTLAKALAGTVSGSGAFQGDGADSLGSGEASVGMAGLPTAAV